MRSRKRKLLLVVLLLAAIGAAAGLWHVRRAMRLKDAVNPLYWVRRWRQEDMFDSRWRLLHHGNRRLREVALTIDDGPHYPTCPQILDALRAEGVRATFFVVGKEVDKKPELVRRMLAEGHEVGNHSQNHLRLDTLNEAQTWREINDGDIYFHWATGRHLRLLRPPGVRYNAQALRVAGALGYVTVTWSCAGNDYRDVSADEIVQSVLQRVENGSIILLHDTYPGTPAALPRLLRELKRQGYRFVTISEMLSRLPEPVHVAQNPQTER
jgi:peptidoglycan/xylan/chitin deacetylase (PgdA/CDA1 family)